MSSQPLVVTTSPPPRLSSLPGCSPDARVVKASEAELLDLAPDAAVIIGDWAHRVHVREDVVKRAVACRLIQQPSAGYENIDVDAATRAGIPVANAGPANAAAVAEFAVMACIAGLRHLREAITDAERPGWDQADWVAKDLRELGGSTVGILGLGSIGRAIAMRLRPFESRMLYNKRSRLSEGEEASMGLEHAELDQLLAQSDVLVVALPLNRETRRLIGMEQLKRLPAGAIVVNVARGDIIDYDALAELLRSGRLGGAALDVYPEEPPANVEELRALPNTLLTPHIAGVTDRAKRNILMNSIANVQRVLAGEPPLWVVNGVG